MHWPFKSLPTRIQRCKLLCQAPNRREMCIYAVILMPLVSEGIAHAETHVNLANSKWVAVVDHLNARYADTRTDCNGKPAHYCSGVLIRGSGLQHAPWDYPAYTVNGMPSSRGVSFSYLRADAHLMNSTAQFMHSYGMVFKATEDQEKDGQRVQLACLFPTDAQTGAMGGGMSDGGTAFCTLLPKFQKDSFVAHSNSEDPGSCQDSVSFMKYLKQHDLTLASATGESLLAAWKETQGKNADRAFRCSFSTKKANQFYAAIRASALNDLWNELMTVAYPKADADIKKLPIEAFVFRTGARNANNDPIPEETMKREAFRIQATYMKITGASISDAPPVVKVDLSSPMPFTLELP